MPSLSDEKNRRILPIKRLDSGPSDTAVGVTDTVL